MIEIVITMGVATVLILGLMQALSFTDRSVRSTNLSGEWTNLQSEIRLVLNNDAACKQAFGSYSLTSLAAPSTTSIPTIALASGVIAQVGKPDTGLQVTSMDLTSDPSTAAVVPDPLGGPGWVRMLVKLTVQTKKLVGDGKSAVGRSTFSQDLRFAVLVDAATMQIVQCGSETSPAQMCYEFGGTYDITKTPHCQLKTGLHNCYSAAACAPGEFAVSAGADCPANYIRSLLPAGATWTLNCAGVSSTAVTLICCQQ